MNALRATRNFLLLLLMVALSGCSLLEVQLDSQTTPLTKQELNMRLMTREYSREFFSQVESTADSLAAQYPENDVMNQSYVLLWKIHAEEGLQQAAYQVSPTAGLIDSWVFTIQMNNFFNQGNGQALFTSDDAKQVSQQLSSEIDQLAKSLFKGDSYATSKEFVEKFAALHPFENLTFSRTPAYREWLKAQGIDESEVTTTLGTMPEALSDVSDRLSLMSEQTPKLMTWKAQLIALNSNVNGDDIRGAIQSFQLSADAFQDFVNNNPEYMRDLAQKMAIELQPLLNDLDAKTQDKLTQLSAERQALDDMVAREREELIKMVERERKEIALIVNQERVLFAQDLDKISQDVVTLAVEKLIQLIKSTIVYFILFILVIFFAPLGLGYILGKKVQARKESKTSA
ncbi:chemotaxis protein [Vibrio mediterranei]|uniref:chemotaxis protein n=1 Tax=Vibrio mediterranei TaxID=689 RepID=UPI0022847B27|nr:chemotaxis protein [Vibrio mediterranei]MCY9851160.1 chemotaxis protein [Vibrio mediterranei]